METLNFQGVKIAIIVFLAFLGAVLVRVTAMGVSC